MCGTKRKKIKIPSQIFPIKHITTHKYNWNLVNHKLKRKVRNQYAFEFKIIHILKFFFKVLASKMKIVKIDFALNFKPPL
jgi:hypothetical protein